MIRSRTVAVLRAIISARTKARFAAASDVDFVAITICSSGSLKSDLVLDLNSLKAYAPSAAPSATAEIWVRVDAGSAKVAVLWPANSRAAEPAALRRFSGS